MRHLLTLTMTFSIGWATLTQIDGPASAQDRLEYNRDVRPILADQCFACHGPDSAARKGDLRLDQRDAAITAKAIVPGDPKNSRLLQRIHSTDPDEQMPPPATKKSLTAAQKKVLEDWITSGAEYQLHWSFLPPQRPALPVVAPEFKNWVKNPIDAFVQEKLAKLGLKKPAPEADRYTLARRVALDITGLPPEPAAVIAFVNDPAPNAYEKYVDQMLQSNRWGEHRARYWLDAARFADTHGIHIDNYREIWAYRDWVIAAFNQNMPFDQFTIEQLAGDLLPNRTLEQQIASGFNRCNITTSEGGAINEEYLVLYARDRTETTATVWMGLSAGCAVCHDHKFDPFSTRDFYSLAAFFNNTTQPAMDGNVKDTPPIVPVPLEADRPRWEVIGREVAEAKQAQAQRVAAARSEHDAWLLNPENLASIAATVPTQGLVLQVPLNEGTGKEFTATVNGQTRKFAAANDLTWSTGTLAPAAVKLSPTDDARIPDAGNFDANEAFTCSAWINLPRQNEQFSAIVAHMDDSTNYRGWDLWMEGGRIGCHIVDQWPDNALKVVTQDPLPQSDRWYFVTITYDGSQKVSGVRVYVDGVNQRLQTQVDKLNGTAKTAVPFTLGRRHVASMLQQLSLQDVRLFNRALPEGEVQQLLNSTRAAAFAALPVEQRTDAQKQALFDWWLNNRDTAYQQVSAKLAQLVQEENAIKARSSITHVMQERGEPAMAYILFRGEYDKRRDSVTPNTPAVMPAMPAELPRNRLGLAQWLLRPDHPLTTRVTVNRVWQELFGTGIVKSAGDFGISGELPSHPELLDWLAIEFRENGWNVKQLYKLVLMSATYRQAAVTTPEKLEKDPQNRFFSRGPRFRMDAEMIRDYALKSTGILAPKIGGPSVRPYQPDGVWEAVAMIGSNTREYVRDSGESLYRRSMYTFWKRSAPPASMDIFNAPSRELCIVRRERTNTPLQALVTMNDIQFVEAGRFLAQNLLAQPAATVDQRLETLGLRVVCRPWTANELQILKASLQQLEGYYQGHPDDARELVTFGESKPDPALPVDKLAAWTMLINEVLNLDEVLNK